jgi:hypothetical protein
VEVRGRCLEAQTIGGFAVVVTVDESTNVMVAKREFE